MLHTSKEYKNGGRSYCKAKISFVDGTVLDVTDEDIMESGFKIEDSVSGDNEFQIGAAIINQLDLQLRNKQDRFSPYDFYEAEIQIWDGRMMADGRIEYLKKGIFTVDAPISPGTTIHLTALDHMAKFDCAYADVPTEYPATLLQIVQDICFYCGVSLASNRFDMDDYIVSSRPEADMNCREMLSYAAQIAGCFARCNVDGALEFKWYDTSAFDGTDDVDGGRFDHYSPEIYETGASVDGGFFDDLSPERYVSGDAIYGGTIEEMGRYHHIYSLAGLTTNTDDVVITGIQVMADGEEAAYLFGEEGYVLAIEKNPLILSGQEQGIAEHLGSKIIGMRFRPLSCSCLGDPTVEAGDCVYVSDYKGNSYPCYLTKVIYTIGDYMSLSCDAKTPSANKGVRYSNSSRTIAAARKETKKQLSTYDMAVRDMTSLMANSMGLFETLEVTESGGRIIYQHDKPELSESQIIWKKSEQGFMASNDGGNTWVAGMDASGNTVLNVLSVIGINFSWARGGTLTLGGNGNGNGILKILNASGKQVGYIDNTGVHFNEGSFTGTVNATTLKSANANITGGKIMIRSDSKEQSVLEFNGRNNGNDIWLNANPYFLSVEEGAKTETTITPYYSTSIGARYIAMHRRDIDGWAFYAGGDIKQMMVGIDAFFYQRLICEGTKSRAIKTNDFGKVLQYCYETPSPMFGDIGSGKLDENGLCYIYFDPIFIETISTVQEYQVFLQKEGVGDIWVEIKCPEYFLVKGTPSLKFSWESKARQRDYEYERLGVFDENPEEQSIDYEEVAVNYLVNYESEMLGNEEIIN